MNERSRCHKAINDWHRIWVVETPPRLSYSLGDRDEAIAITADQLAEPTFEDLSLSRVPAGKPLDAVPDLAYDEHTEEQPVRRN